MTDGFNLANLLPQHPRPWKIQIVGVCCDAIDALGDTIISFDEDDPLWPFVVKAVNSAALPSPAALDPVTVEACAQVAETCGPSMPSSICIPSISLHGLRTLIAKSIRALIGQPAPTGKSEQIVERLYAGHDSSEAVPVWRGEASQPSELADEIAAIPTKTVQLPYVEPIEVVELTISLANRDMIIDALRASPTGNAQERDENPLVEVWQGDRKVSIYPKHIFRVWGTDIDQQMSSDDLTLETAQEAFDWLYAAPASNAQESVLNPEDIWDDYCAEVSNPKDRSPQGAMAFAIEALSSTEG